MAINFDGAKQVAKPSEFDKHLNAATGTKGVITTTAGKKVGESEDTYKVPIDPLAVPAHKLARVTVEGSQTVNLGNYNSARVGVSVEWPCNIDQLDAAYEKASDWVSNKIMEAVKELPGGAQD